MFLIATSEQIPHAQQNISVGSKGERARISDHRKLKATFHYESWMCCVLKSGSQVILGCTTACDGKSIETTVAPMNKSCFENQKQLSPRFMRIVRQHILQIGAETLFVAHPKSVSLTTENRFRISAED
jgi:hypothetical protein